MKSSSAQTVAGPETWSHGDLLVISELSVIAVVVRHTFLSEHADVTVKDEGALYDKTAVKRRPSNIHELLARTDLLFIGVSLKSSEALGVHVTHEFGA